MDSPPMSVIDMDDDRPIAVRRKRRSSAGLSKSGGFQFNNGPAGSRSYGGIATPPATPQRNKKRVRFSDPGPALQETGLTPFIRRTSLFSPPPSKSRRQSTPSTLWNLSSNESPISGTIQFEPFRQVLEGRVKRRLRRNHLSEETNIIELEKRIEYKMKRNEMERLREQLRQKDQEIQALRDEQDLASQIGDEAGIPVPQNASTDELVRTLEAQVTHLKAQLQRHVSDGSTFEDPNWTMAARDPFNDDDEAFMMPDYDNDFNDDMSGVLLSTPARGSFPSPPGTMPNTPSKPPSLKDSDKSSSASNAEKLHLESQLQTLQTELQELRATLELANSKNERTSAKLTPFLAPDDGADDSDSIDAALDCVLTQLALAQSASLEKESRFLALSNEINTLGFSKNSPESTIKTLRTQFRQARLELEHLVPGETPQGFENSQLLDMLIARLRILVQKTKQQESDIDQYHAEEVSLRKQLGARYEATTLLQATISSANEEIKTLSSHVNERDSSLGKLNRALEGYRQEVRNLEALIARLDTQHKSESSQLTAQIAAAKSHGEEKVLDEILQRDVVQAQLEGQEMLVAELQNRLASTMTALSELETKVADLTASAAKNEHENGSALTLRDDRVRELKTELERVNELLKLAYATIEKLKGDRGALEKRLGDEKRKGRDVIEAMRAQLKRVIEVGGGYLAPSPAKEKNGREKITPSVIVRPGGLFDMQSARRLSTSSRKSGAGLEADAMGDEVAPRSAEVHASTGGKAKKRRRYDSSLGFLEEADDTVEGL